MKRVIYWMIFQMGVGIWLFISPFVLGFTGMVGPAMNNMLVGAIITILGLGVVLNETGFEDFPETTLGHRP